MILGIKKEETLLNKGFLLGDPSGIRTPDTLIKSFAIQILLSYFYFPLKPDKPFIYAVSKALKVATPLFNIVKDFFTKRQIC